MQNRLKIGTSVDNSCRFTFTVKGRDSSGRGTEQLYSNNSKSELQPSHRRNQSNPVEESQGQSLPNSINSLPKIKQALAQGKYAQFLSKQNTASNSMHHSRKPTGYLLDASTAADNASMLSDSYSKRMTKPSPQHKVSLNTPSSHLLPEIVPFHRFPID